MTCPVNTVVEFLQELAPLDLAESWDNVGLLLGDSRQPVQRIMTCLTLTHDVAAEAIERKADLIVSHHPILFRPVQKLTSDTADGRLVLRLIQAGISVYSPHTAFDSARQGINQQLAEGLGLQGIRPLRPSERPGQETVGGGRWGHFPAPVTLDDLLPKIRMLLKVRHIPVVGPRNTSISTVAIACGAAGEFLDDAAAVGCDLFLTGETRFHTCLDARDREMVLLLPGHYATERPGIERLAEILANQFRELQIWASAVESDPVSFETDARS